MGLHLGPTFRRPEAQRGRKGPPLLGQFFSGKLVGKSGKSVENQGKSGNSINKLDQIGDLRITRGTHIWNELDVDGFEQYGTSREIANQTELRIKVSALPRTPLIVEHYLT